MTERPGAVPVEGGIRPRYSWSVWSGLVEHRVDVALNLLTGGISIDVDGVTVVTRSGWRAGPSGMEVQFEVAGRPCLLVVRTRYGDQVEVDLFSDGRSLTSGAPLDDRRKVYSTEIPNVARFLLIFLPLFGVPSAIRSFLTMDVAPPTWAWVVVIGAGVSLALAGWWVVSRWYRRGPEARNRHLVGGGIVALTWVAFFAIWIGTTLATR